MTVLFDTVIQILFIQMMVIHIFWGELTNTSAVKEPLVWNWMNYEPFMAGLPVPYTAFEHENAYQLSELCRVAIGYPMLDPKNRVAITSLLSAPGHPIPACCHSRSCSKTLLKKWLYKYLAVIQCSYILYKPDTYMWLLMCRIYEDKLTCRLPSRLTHRRPAANICRRPPAGELNAGRRAGQGETKKAKKHAFKLRHIYKNLLT